MNKTFLYLFTYKYSKREKNWSQLTKYKYKYLGIYKTLSATTKPTVTNKLEAGMYGITNIDIPIQSVRLDKSWQ
jgi:hypothetical protein